MEPINRRMKANIEASVWMSIPEVLKVREETWGQWVDIDRLLSLCDNHSTPSVIQWEKVWDAYEKGEE